MSLTTISDAAERPLTDKERVQERFPHTVCMSWTLSQRWHQIRSGHGYPSILSLRHHTEAAAWEDAARRLER